MAGKLTCPHIFVNQSLAERKELRITVKEMDVLSERAEKVSLSAR